MTIVDEVEVQEKKNNSSQAPPLREVSHPLRHSFTQDHTTLDGSTSQNQPQLNQKTSCAELRQVGGCLKDYLEEWEKITSDKFVLDILRKGYAPEFRKDKSPPQLTTTWKRFDSINSHTPPKQATLLRDHVKELLQKGAVEQVKNKSSRGLYSHLFLVPKKNGKLRPVINLKKLNKSLVIPRFTMETTSTLATSMLPDEWATSIDLTDAYFHVPILPAFRKWMRIVVDGKMYQFKALPFGLSTAPLIFTRVLEPVAVYLHSQGIQLHRYLDDLLIKAKSRDLCLQWTTEVLHLLFDLGLGVNLAKSDLSPKQDFVYIGVRFLTNKRLMVPPDDRITKIRSFGLDLIKGGGRPARTWLKWIGLLTSAEKQVPWGRIHLRPIQQCVRRQFKIFTDHLDFTTVLPDADCIQAIKWWRSLENLTQGKSLDPFVPDIVLHTDASLTRWGAHTSDIKMSGVWSKQERKKSINQLELLAVIKALLKAPQEWNNKKLLVSSDNTTTVAYLKNQGGTKSMALLKLTFWMYQVLQDKNISMEARHIPGRLNRMADLLSRGDRVVNTEWTLHQSIFNRILSKWGPIQVDLMATQLNNKLQTYVSPMPDPAAVAVDVLLAEWTWQSVYAFPPWLMILPILEKFIQQESCKMVLIAPMWPNRSWFPLLLSLVIDRPVKLPLFQDLITMPLSNIPHSNLELLNLHAWRISSNPLHRRDFLHKLQRKLPLGQSESLHRETTTPSGTPLETGVVSLDMIPSQPLCK